MTIRLTPDELRDITGGLTQPAAQVRTLQRWGFWLAVLGADGSVVLTWDHYRAVCAGAAPPDLRYAGATSDQPRPRVKGFETA